jgi:hypothetical protein
VSDTSERQFVLQALGIELGEMEPVRPVVRREPLGGGDLALAVVAAVLLALIGLIVISGGRIDLAGALSNPTDSEVAMRGVEAIGM